MPLQFKAKEVAIISELIAAGAAEANYFYKECTRASSIYRRAGEQILVTKVMENVYKNFCRRNNLIIQPETYIRECAIPKMSKGLYRFDLGIFDESKEKCFGIIELKTQFKFAKIHNDIKKFSLLRRSATVSHCWVAGLSEEYDGTDFFYESEVNQVNTTLERMKFSSFEISCKNFNTDEKSRNDYDSFTVICAAVKL